MTRVDFYLLPDHNAHAPALYACRLTEKAYKQGLRTLILTRDQEQSRYLDQLLWTYRDGSFVPHSLATAPNAATQPIVIHHEPVNANQATLLINLGENIPAQWQEFGRVAEIVGNDTQMKHSGRLRYKQYRDLTDELHHHEIQ